MRKIMARAAPSALAPAARTRRFELSSQLPVVTLPIDALLPRILASLRAGPNLVIEAPPGAGKTTRVPPALLPLDDGEVWTLEPRRLATRLAARRIAQELGEPLGETVGYQVRFEQIAGPRTRLRFLTEGVFTRRFQSNPRLRGVSTVILDEFHERHLDTDFALALLRRLQTGERPDLRIVVMSATLEAAPIAAFFGGAPVLVSEGRLFPIGIRYTPHSAAPLEERVARALDVLLEEGLDGDVLVFLPGAAEIRRAARALEPAARRANLLVLPLHGDLSPEEQDRAVSPAGRPKVILSTNVAESSVTIEGVTAVIDSGLARLAEDSPWTGLPMLRIGRVSKASARQRAGRAGRTAPGRVIRLYPEEDFLRRPEQVPAEILRRELSEMALALHALGAGRFEDLPWLDAPPEASVRAAEELLERLGAVAHGRFTETGRRMAGLPLPPRLARLALVGHEACLLAALLSAGERLPASAQHTGPSDLLVLADAPPSPYVRQLTAQIRRALGRQPHPPPDETALLQAALAAFPDRAARRRNRDDLLLSSGGSAVLAASSTVRNAEFLVAIDIEERQERGQPLVRLASAIQPEWLLDMFPDRIHERTEAAWNRAAERVETSSVFVYDELVIDESRAAAGHAEAAAELLAAKAIEAGAGRFADLEELEQFLARVSFAAQHVPLPALTMADANAALAELCRGLRSFDELRAAAANGGLIRRLEQRLPGNAARLLDQAAPLRLRLPSGRQARIRYPADKPPYAASRLQDFFGLDETPRIANGKVPLVLHLLAPNHRPVQVTTDLAGFWERLYPQVRKELMRRYPKHAWPERPR